MKTILAFFSLIILAVSCQQNQNKNANENISSKQIVSKSGPIDITAVFWIDKAERDTLTYPYHVRTVKAKVLIHEDGKVDLKEFIKDQTPSVDKYIRHHLAKFQIPPKEFGPRRIKPGEQIVQLRYLWEAKQKKIMQD